MKRIEIEIDLKTKSDFVSEYNDNTLDPTLKNYIINELVGYDSKAKVVIYIKPKYKIKDDEQTQYRKIIRKEFRESLADLENLRRKSNMKRVSLFLIGLFSFLIQMRLGEYIGTVISEIINIIGWVCIWEFIYSILFTAISRKNDIDRLRQILNAEIEFK